MKMALSDLLKNPKVKLFIGYFQIFLSRMLIASEATKSMDCKFGLYINETKV